MIDSTDPAVQRLYQHMTLIFDAMDADEGKEWHLWDALACWRHCGHGHYQPSGLVPHDITEYMPRLEELFREAHGWVWWVKSAPNRRPLPRFVPWDRWSWLASLRGTEAPRATNEELSEMYPADPVAPRG